MIITSHNKQQSTRIEYASSDSLVMGCNVPAFCTSGPAPVNDVSDVKFLTQSLCTSAHSIVLWCYNNSRSLCTCVLIDVNQTVSLESWCNSKDRPRISNMYYKMKKLSFSSSTISKKINKYFLLILNVETVKKYNSRSPPVLDSKGENNSHNNNKTMDKIMKNN